MSGRLSQFPLHLSLSSMKFSADLILTKKQTSFSYFLPKFHAYYVIKHCPI